VLLWSFMKHNFVAACYLCAFFNMHTIKSEESYGEKISSLYNSTITTIGGWLHSTSSWIKTHIEKSWRYDSEKAQRLLETTLNMERLIKKIIKDVENLDKNVSKDHTIRPKIEKLKDQSDELHDQIIVLLHKVERRFEKKSKNIFKLEPDINELENRCKKISKKVAKINFIES